MMETIHNKIRTWANQNGLIYTKDKNLCSVELISNTDKNECYVIYIQDDQYIDTYNSIGNGIEINKLVKYDVERDYSGKAISYFYTDLSNNGIERLQKWLNEYSFINNLNLSDFPILTKEEFVYL